MKQPSTQGSQRSGNHGKSGKVSDLDFALEFSEMSLILQISHRMSWIFIYFFVFSWQEILNLFDPTTTLSTLIFWLAVADKHFRCTML